MSASMIIFYIGSAAVLVASIMAVTSGKLLRAAIYLLFVLVGIAIFYLSLDYMFLAAVQVVVYMGGILVLIIFSILLTSQLNERMEQPAMLVYVLAGLAVVIGAGVVGTVVYGTSWIADFQVTAPTVNDIGTTLLSTGSFGYVLPFEVISILLLAAMIGAIVIAKREKSD